MAKMNIGLSLDEEIVGKLDKEAVAADRSRSSMLNIILKEHYK